jgi:hypothetical protein
LFEYIELFINTFLGIIAIVFAGMGLFLWRKQLRGGDLYLYAKESLCELKKIIYLIEEYRYVFLNEEQENGIWLEIKKQYSLYESKIIVLTILSNNKINDCINNKNIKDYITIMYKNIYEKKYYIDKQKKDEILESEREDISKRMIDIDKILKIRNEKDIDNFGNELNEYFLLMCKKLKKYIE